ncbi:hypothetical protein L596_021058 [Steinernema carpocapsae]|uniref:Uncharacterized protein n=1 Tax=Steinernema carpocapsae TaxID=34508 RepID=A0A4U5MVA8_STECR|nr:hypothetical protein L596_021058 [Steinernema carpocapsae]
MVLLNFDNSKMCYGVKRSVRQAWLLDCFWTINISSALCRPAPSVYLNLLQQNSALTLQNLNKVRSWCGKAPQESCNSGLSETNKRDFSNVVLIVTFNYPVSL